MTLKEAASSVVAGPTADTGVKTRGGSNTAR